MNFVNDGNEVGGLVGRGAGSDRRRNSGNERAENRETAIRCLEERKGEADGGGGGGGRHGEVEAVAGGWTTASLYTSGRGSRRGSGEMSASETKRQRPRREVETVMGGIRKRGGKKSREDIARN